MSEEHRVYVPLRGKHVEPAPIFYSARWYEEQGISIPADTRLTRLRRWIRRTVEPVFELDRKERHLRIWRLSIWWDIP